MQDAQKEMETSAEIEDQKESSQKFTEAQAWFQAESKLFSMVTQAASTALKSSWRWTHFLGKKAVIAKKYKKHQAVFILPGAGVSCGSNQRKSYKHIQY
jgi:hypothetical protein